MKERVEWRVADIGIGRTPLREISVNEKADLICVYLDSFISSTNGYKSEESKHPAACV